MRRKSRDSPMSIGVVQFYNDGVRGSGGNVRLSRLLVGFLYSISHCAVLIYTAVT